ncbi:hypothetical protein [Pseudomonas sp. S9]|uniref:hypothetical protein n=1 Tax=Pseudomonas sp. S9 TaxID=686578 RepID=UPI0002D3DCA4|nr:hypothetical protein [Pseudomonas sp. S9]
MDADELKAWDMFAAAALKHTTERYVTRPELAAEQAATFADAMVEERRRREIVE